MKKSIILITMMIVGLTIRVVFINTHYDSENIVNIEKVMNIDKMPLLNRLIIGDDYYIALCRDGTVWSWGDNAEGKLGIIANTITEPQKIKELENIVEVLDGDEVVYALDSKGNVYTWGRKLKYLFRQTDSKDSFAYEPEKIENLENIIKIDVGNNILFALDCDGNLYSLGLYLYSGDEGNEVHLLISNTDMLSGSGINGISAGAGYYHYFIRKDRTVFSIMEYFNNGDGAPYAFIFPCEYVQRKESQNINGYYALEDLENITILSDGTKEGAIIYYNLEGVNGVQTVNSDRYTVFISKTDGTLWFWNSDRIKYHDNLLALANPKDGNESIQGNFEEVIIEGVERLCVIEIQSGREHTIFLTEDGHIFFSSYTTCQVENVDYFKRSNPDPGRIPSVHTIEDMSLKTVTFQMTDLENIVSIYSDNKDNFSAIDSEGNCYYITFMED